MKKEIVKTGVKEAEVVEVKENPIDIPMGAIIEQAIAKDSPLEVMQTLIAFQEKREMKWAKERFFEAMAKFQSECPTIQKTRQGNKSKFASLDDIVGQTKELRTRHGFSFRFEEESKEKESRAVCVVNHQSGHSERSTFPIMAEKVMSKSGGAVRSENQDYASALTFAKRYAFCNAFGIMTGDVDTDSVSESRNEWIEKIEECKVFEDLKKVYEEMTKSDPKSLKDPEIAKVFNLKKSALLK